MPYNFWRPMTEREPPEPSYAPGRASYEAWLRMMQGYPSAAESTGPRYPGYWDSPFLFPEQGANTALLQDWRMENYGQLPPSGPGELRYMPNVQADYRQNLVDYLPMTIQDLAPPGSPRDDWFFKAIRSAYPNLWRSAGDMPTWGSPRR